MYSFTDVANPSIVLLSIFIDLSVLSSDLIVMSLFIGSPCLISSPVFVFNVTLIPSSVTVVEVLFDVFTLNFSVATLLSPVTPALVNFNVLLPVDLTLLLPCHLSSFPMPINSNTLVSYLIAASNAVALVSLFIPIVKSILSPPATVVPPDNVVVTVSAFTPNGSKNNISRNNKTLFNFFIQTPSNYLHHVLQVV